MIEPTAWMICAPTATHAPSVQGCTREYCGICAEEVWLSPASKEMAPEGFACLCLDCAPGVIALDPDPEFMPASADQLAEVRQAPVCPGCGTRATWHGDHWESSHPRTCSWLADPHSEPY
jgi:hypothetical protein